MRCALAYEDTLNPALVVWVQSRLLGCRCYAVGYSKETSDVRTTVHNIRLMLSEIIIISCEYSRLLFGLGRLRH